MNASSPVPLAEECPDNACDRDLLHRFAEARDGDAFTLLLRRHGPLVLGLARRIVGDYQAAEDVFQATFLTLARRAATIHRAEALPSWLHGVAFRLAVRVRRSRLRRQEREAHVRPAPPTSPLDELTAREFLVVLDEELEALPHTYRAPLILCCLEGLSQDEAARRLGCSAGSVKGRLERGRARLRAGLAKRGLTLPTVLAGPLLLASSASAVPAALLQSTRDAVLTGSGAAPAALTLAREAMGLSAAGKLRSVCAVLMLVILGSAGAWLLAGGAPAGGEREAAANPAAQQPPSGQRSDLHGDPLPDGAVLRLGTIQRRAVGAVLAMSPDGQTIIGVRGSKVIHEWDADTGKLRQTRELPDLWSYQTWLSPGGRWLVTGGGRREALALWDVRTGKQAQTLTIKGAGSYIMPVAFSPNGKLVAAAGAGGGQRQKFVRVWDLATGQEVFAKDLQNDVGTGLLAFSPDSRRLLASFTSVEVGMYCWDLATGALVWQNKDFAPHAMVILPDGRILSATGPDRVVDLATGQPVSMERKPPLAWDNQLTVAADGRTLLIASADGVKVWDLVEGKELRTIPGAGEELVIAPDGRSIVTSNGALQRWDLATGRPLYPDNFEQGHVGEVTGLVFSADGKHLASRSQDGTVRLWDVTTGRPLHVWRGHEARRPGANWRLKEAGVTALDLSPDGRWVLSAGTEERILLRDAATGKEVRSILLPAAERGEDGRRVYHVHISPDGARAVGLFGAQGFFFSTGDASPTPTNKLVTWDVRTGERLDSKSVEIRKPTALTRDGRTLLLGDMLTDVASGRDFRRLDGMGHSGSGEPAAFSGDGALVVGALTKETQQNGMKYVSSDGLGVWETATGKLVARLKTKTWVAQPAFHANNCFVVTNDMDGIQIWDALTDKVVATRKLPEQVRCTTTAGSFAGCLAFTPDGRRLATGHPDGTILLWDLPLPPTPPMPLAAGERDRLWAALASADASEAWRAVWRLTDVPAETLPLLREHLKPAAPAPADAVRREVEALDDESFPRRKEAVERLKQWGALAEPALRETLKGKPSAEQQRLIQEVLTTLEIPPTLNGDTLREVRAVTVLERMGSAEARRTLAELAKGVEAAPLTRVARTALDRLP